MKPTLTQSDSESFNSHTYFLPGWRLEFRSRHTQLWLFLRPVSFVLTRSSLCKYPDFLSLWRHQSYEVSVLHNDLSIPSIHCEHMLGSWELEFQHIKLVWGTECSPQYFLCPTVQQPLCPFIFFFFTLHVSTSCLSLGSINSHQAHFIVSPEHISQPHPLGLHTRTCCFVNILHQPASSLGVPVASGSTESRSVCFSCPLHTDLDPRGA